MVIWPGADAHLAVEAVMQQRPSAGLIVLPSRAISLTSTAPDDDFVNRLRFVEPHEITVTNHPRSFVVRAWMRTRGLDILQARHFNLKPTTPSVYLRQHS